MKTNVTQRRNDSIRKYTRSIDLRVAALRSLPSKAKCHRRDRIDIYNTEHKKLVKAAGG
jgi:hypothetical protein